MSIASQSNSLINRIAAAETTRAIGWRFKRGLRKFGMDFPRVPDLVDFLRSRDVDLVVDVGANTGQFGRRLRRLGYRNRIVSFEPLKAAFDELTHQGRADELWSCYNYALGDEAGRVSLNVSHNTVYSSILSQTDIAQDPASAVYRTELVDVKRLDDLRAELRGDRIFLKVDTQGFEKSVLSGGQAFLASVVGVEIELPVCKLYQQTWTFLEAIAYMNDAGFVLCQLTPASARANDPVSAFELDGVFRRIDDRD